MSLCIIKFGMCMLLMFAFSTAVSIPGITPSMTVMMVLNDTNIKFGGKILLNLIIMKLDLAFEIYWKPNEKSTEDE